MKKIIGIGSVLTVLLSLVGMGGSAAAITASPGSCFVMNGGPPRLVTGLQRVNCNTYKAIYPSIAIDSSKCYIADARTGTGFAAPGEVSCHQVPDKTTDSIPRGSVPPTSGSASKPFVPDECAGNNKAASCANIPIGCPGSSVQGPVATVDPSKCPYAVNPNAPAPTASPVSAPSAQNVQSLADSDRSKTLNCNGSTPAGLQQCLKDNPLVKALTTLINVVSALAGIAVVIMVIVGGIQYASAGPNPQAVMAARKRIINAILALVALIFTYAFLQWLVPGGVL